MTPQDFEAWERELGDLVSEYLDSGNPMPADQVDAFLGRYPERRSEIQRVMEGLGLIDTALRPEPPRAMPLDEDLPEIPAFEILGLIGQGGMGVVYRARDRFLGREVAIKVIRKGLSEERARRRFLLEARTVARLEHPGIIRVHAAGEAAGLPYIVMELARGRPIDEVLRQSVADAAGAPEADEPPLRMGIRALLSPRTVATIGKEVAEALSYAHSRGVIHRDVKPSNLILQPDGSVRITDFGLSRLTSDELDVGSLGSSFPRLGALEESLSREGELVGTPPYLDPAIIEGHPASESSDIYSLGVTLYQLLTDRLPFRATSQAALLYSIVREEPIPPRKLVPDIPRDLEAVVLKAMEKEPALRYRDAAGLADDLDRFLAGQPVRAPHRTPVGRALRLLRRHRRATLTAAVAVALLAAAVFWALHRPGTLTIRGTAPGQLVVVDGEEVGVTPLVDLPVPPGSHRVELRAEGLIHAPEVIRVPPLGETVYNAPLVPDVGYLILRCQPDEAHYEVFEPGGGRKVEEGTTEKTLTLRHGRYRVRFSKAGYETWERDVEVPFNRRHADPNPKLRWIGARVRISTDLDRVPLDVDLILPDGERETKVSTRISPVPTELSLEPGEYAIRADLLGYYPTEVRRRFEARTTRRVHLYLRSQRPIWGPRRGFSPHRNAFAHRWPGEDMPTLVALQENDDLLFLDPSTGAELWTYRLASLVAGTGLADRRLRIPTWNTPRFFETAGRRWLLLALEAAAPRDPELFLGLWDLGDAWGPGAPAGPRRQWLLPVAHRGGPVEEENHPEILIWPGSPSGQETALALISTGLDLKAIELPAGLSPWTWSPPPDVEGLETVQLLAVDTGESPGRPLVLVHSGLGDTFALDLPGAHPRIRWRAHMFSSAGRIRASDLDGDGVPELVLPNEPTATAASRLAVIDALTGERRWERELGKCRLFTTLIADISKDADGREILAGCSDGELRVLGGRDGSTVSMLPPEPDARESIQSLQLLRFPADSTAQLIKVMTSGRVVGYGIDRIDREPLWRLNSEAPILTHPLITDLRGDGYPELLIHGRDGSLQAVPGPRSRVVWESVRGFKDNLRPLLLRVDDDDRLDIISHSGQSGCVALRGVDGAVLWEGPPGYGEVVGRDLDGDDEPELITRGKDGLAVLDRRSGQVTRTIPSGPTTDLQVIIAGVSGYPEVVAVSEAGHLAGWSVQRSDTSPVFEVPLPLAGEDSYSPFRLANLDTDPNPEVIVSLNETEHLALDLPSGEILWRLPNPTRTSSAAALEVEDVTGDDRPEIFLSARFGQLGCHRGDSGKAIWVFDNQGGDRPDNYFKSQPVFWQGPDSGVSAPRLYLALSDTLRNAYLLDARTGELIWREKLGSMASEVQISDLDFDGRPDVLAVTRDRFATLFDGRAAGGRSEGVLWRVRLDASTGSAPVIGDLLGGPTPEVVVATRNSRIVVLEGRTAR